MIPNIVIFGKEITMYSVTALIGIFLVLFLTYRLARKRGLDEIHMLYMMLFSFAGVLLGGHIFYGFTNAEMMAYALTHLNEITSFEIFINTCIAIFGGSVYYGGLIGAIIACCLYIRHQKLPFKDYADIAAIAIPLFHTFGRLGCFISGCCYGIPWQHGFTYHYCMIASANGVPRFPVQLVEAILNLVLFFIMHHLLKKEKLKGLLLLLYLSVYPVYRFALEFLRGDAYRGFLGPLSTSQFISLLLLLASAIGWIKNAKNIRQAAL